MSRFLNDNYLVGFTTSFFPNILALHMYLKSATSDKRLIQKKYLQIIVVRKSVDELFEKSLFDIMEVDCKLMDDYFCELHNNGFINYVSIESNPENNGFILPDRTMVDHIDENNLIEKLERPLNKFISRYISINQMGRRLGRKKKMKLQSKHKKALINLLKTIVVWTDARDLNGTFNMRNYNGLRARSKTLKNFKKLGIKSKAGILTFLKELKDLYDITFDIFGCLKNLHSEDVGVWEHK